MAKEIEKRINRISLKHLTQIDVIQDEFIERLRETYTRISIGLGNELRALASAEGITDLALAKNQLDRIFIESGYFDDIGDMINDGYQRAINEAFLSYQEIFNSNFQFSDVSLARINSLKQLDLSQFNQLTADAVEKISRNIINTQFGAISVNDAIAEIQAIMIQNQGWVNTWVNTALESVYRESNVLLAQDVGFEKFLYLGPSDQITRPFCRQHIGETKTVAEWNELDNGQLRPVSTFAGGFNCRHQLVAVE